MKPSKRVVLMGLVAVLVSSLAFAGTTYQIDPLHSKVLFRVKHLGISTVTGTFKEFAGTFTLDPSDLASLAAKATIEAASIDTGVADRDNHLRSPDFLDVENHPEITFVSTKAEKVSDNRVKLHGELTIRGVTKPVVLDVEFGGVADFQGQKRAALTASTKINRKDFNVTWNQILDNGGLVVGEEVDIVLEIEGVAQEATE